MTTAYTNTINSRGLIRGQNGFPVKLYNFESALDVFSNTEEIKLNLMEMMNIFNPRQFSPVDYKYSIALAWGYYDKGCDKREVPVKAFDVFSYRFDKPWNECNPDVDAFPFTNLSLNPNNKNISCETGTIILGEEAKLRRTTKTVEEYLKKWPDIGDLIQS